MAFGRLILVLSEWNAESHAWILPKLRGLSVEDLRESDGQIDSTKWKYEALGNDAIIYWISDQPPPKTPRATVRFREISLFTKFLDPAILAPVLAFLGVLSGAYIQSRTQLFTASLGVSQSQDKHDLADMATKATIAGCNRGLSGVAAVSACLDDWTSNRNITNGLQKTLGQEQERNEQLKLSYNQLKVAFQQNCRH